MKAALLVEVLLVEMEVVEEAKEALFVSSLFLAHLVETLVVEAEQLLLDLLVEMAEAELAVFVAKMVVVTVEVTAEVLPMLLLESVVELIVAVMVLVAAVELLELFLHLVVLELTALVVPMMALVFQVNPFVGQHIHRVAILQATTTDVQLHHRLVIDAVLLEKALGTQPQDRVVMVELDGQPQGR